MDHIFEKICDGAAWEDFYAHKRLKEPENGKFLLHLRAYMNEKSYLAHAERLQQGASFPSPAKKLISKGLSTKKRAVFIFPQDDNLLLKFIARHLKRYDRLFAPNLYSFRSFKTAKDAWCHLTRIKHLSEKFVYKVDISNYFCSIGPNRILPDLREVLQDDPALYGILEQILLDPYAVVNGKKQMEKKGVLPGVPTSAFLANLFLREMDWYFFRSRIEYLRYSDDIIVFADSREELEKYANRIKETLAEKDLSINAEKEVYAAPGEAWEFLGFSYTDGEVDVSSVALDKIRGKMRRKTRALKRWADKKKLPGTYAAKAFVKRFNAKLFENPMAGELTWVRWYFPVITTDASLKIIDAYAQDCIRYLATGRHTKKRFDFRYHHIKALGYKSLVNAYYQFKKGEFSLPQTEQD